MLSWLFKSLLWCHRKMVASMESKQTLYIKYFIYWFRNQYWSSIHWTPLCLMTQNSSLSDCSPWFANFHFGLCRGKFVDSPRSQTFQRNYGFTYFERCSSFFFPRCLAGLSCLVKAVQKHQRFSVAVWKNEICKY